MKTIARVKFCEGFIKALKNTKDFPNLHTYCRHWANNIEADDTILCEVVDDTDIKTGQPKKSLDIELALFDYFSNAFYEKEEGERRKLLAMVNNNISRQILKIVKI